MRRCLIVANQTLTGPHLVNEVLARAASEPYEFHLLVPATHPSHGFAGWTEGEALKHARERLAEGLETFSEAGVVVTGEVGDQNPVLAIGDVLNRDRFDEVIVSTLPPGASRWLKRDLPHRIERKYDVRVSHLVARPASAPS
jgi:hypothetical protein